MAVVGRTRNCAAAAVKTLTAESLILICIDDKIGPAAAIHPDSSPVKTPAIALVARRVAALLQNAHSAARVRRTVAPMSVIRRTRNRLGRASRTENDECGNDESQLNPIPRIKHCQPPESNGQTTLELIQPSGIFKFDRSYAYRLRYRYHYRCETPCELRTRRSRTAAHPRSRRRGRTCRRSRRSESRRRCAEQLPEKLRRATASQTQRAEPAWSLGPDAGSLHLLRDLAQVTDASARDSQTRRTSANLVAPDPIDSGSTRTGPTAAPRLTTKVCPGAAGGLGTLKLAGAFAIRGTVFHPAQVLPGCQNHP